MHAKESAWLHWIRRGGIVSSSGSFLESGEHALRGRLPTIFIAFLSRSALPPLLHPRTFLFFFFLRAAWGKRFLAGCLRRVFEVFLRKDSCYSCWADWEESSTRGRGYRSNDWAKRLHKDSFIRIIQTRVTSLSSSFFHSLLIDVCQEDLSCRLLRFLNDHESSNFWGWNFSLLEPG